MKVVYFGVCSPTQNILSLALRLKWPDVSIIGAETAASGLKELGEEPAELICLCPDSNSLPLVETILAVRRRTRVPIMVLSERATATKAAISLNMGADEYVKMPCDLNELLARAWAVVRRSGGGLSVTTTSPPGSCSLFLNSATLEVFLGQQKINLTRVENRMLRALVENRTAVVPTHTLFEQIWGQQDIDFHSRVKKCIQRLRKKLGDDASQPTWIANIHGIGYRFIGPTGEGQQPEMA
jgi:two-component system KDP operon response regulator KdpE